MAEIEKEGLSQKELEQQESEELPDREEMALVNTNVAIPINAAVAANVLSDDAIAYANAEQDSIMDQSTSKPSNRERRLRPPFSRAASGPFGSEVRN